MIFNENFSNTATAAIDEFANVPASKYGFDESAALMHVYENECNYNALMKAAALSEMEYFCKTGGDLFVQEAGALKALVDKVVAFLVKVRNKIVGMFKAFMNYVTAAVSKDAEFVKAMKKRKIEAKKVKMEAHDPAKKNAEFKCKKTADKIVSADTEYTEEGVEKQLEKLYGGLVGKETVSDSDLSDELKEYFLGDADERDMSVSDCLSLIESYKNMKKNVEDAQKSAVNCINTMINNAKRGMPKTTDTEEDKKKENTINQQIKIYRAYSNALTQAAGAKLNALKVLRAEAKKACVKAANSIVNPKKDDDTVHEMFAAVKIL